MTEYADRGQLDPFFHEIVDHRMADLELTDKDVAALVERSPGWVRSLRVGPRTFPPTPRDMSALLDALQFTAPDVRDVLLYAGGYEVDSTKGGSPARRRIIRRYRGRIRRVK